MFNLTPTVRNLLIANILFFLAQSNFLPQITQLGSLYPLGSPYFKAWQFLTYMFLHGSWTHLLFNMFGLISFGPMLEQRWGGTRFLTFWLICGFGAGVLYEGTRFYESARMETARTEFSAHPTGGDFADFFRTYYPDARGYETLAAALTRNPNDAVLRQSAVQSVDSLVNEVRNSPNGGMLGASGALFGVLMAFAYLFPNTKLIIFPLPIPLAAKYVIFGYAALELFQGIHRVPGDNVAHFAHLGGLLIGFVVLKIWERTNPDFY